MAAKSQTDKKTGGDAHYERAGATLLTQAPFDSVPAKSRDHKTAEWNSLQQHLDSALTSDRQWRQSWWSDSYIDLAKYLEPRRSTWLTQNSGGIPSPNSMGRGKKLNSAIVDPTGTFAVRICSSGLMSGLASPSRPWFKILPTASGVQIDADGRAWLDEVENRIYTVLANSNFYNSFAQECEDLVVFGTAPVLIYEDEIDLIRCYNPSVGEYFLSSGATLRVDGFKRSFLMTVKMMVDFFGFEKCPPEVQTCWVQKGGALNQEFTVAHSIEPNFAVAGGYGQVPGNFSWREVYWCPGMATTEPLSMRGFVEQPFTAARWATQSNDAYGRSVGMDVLPDIIQLQVMTLRLAEAIEKQVRPPMLADMQLKNQPSSILPGHVTYVNGLGPSTGMRPIYEVTPDIRGMMENIAAIQARVQKGLFNDVILMLSTNPGDRRTAYEVAQLMQERLQVFGPVIENILSESLKPRLKRIYGIMKRKNMLPPMPASMKNIPLDITFISMLALAQKAAATGGLERLAALIGNMVAVFPEAKDKLNVDNFIDEMNELLDNSQRIIRGAEEVAQIRQAVAQKQQQMEQEQQVHAGVATAATGAQAAQTLAATQIGGGQNVLDQMFGGRAGSGTGS